MAKFAGDVDARVVLGKACSVFMYSRTTLLDDFNVGVRESGYLILCYTTALRTWRYQAIHAIIL